MSRDQSTRQWQRSRRMQNRARTKKNPIGAGSIVRTTTRRQSCPFFFVHQSVVGCSACHSRRPEMGWVSTYLLSQKAGRVNARAFPTEHQLRVWGTASIRPARLVIHEMAVGHYLGLNWVSLYRHRDRMATQREFLFCGITTTLTAFVQPKRLPHEGLPGQRAKALRLAPLLHSPQPKERQRRDDS